MRCGKMMIMLRTDALPTPQQKVRDLAILLLLTAIILGIVYKTSSQEFSFRGDGADYASIARNLVRGKGLHSDLIYPLSLTFPFLRQLPQPLVHRSPLYPIVLAGFFSLTSVSDQSIKLLGMLFFLLTIPLVYLTALIFFQRFTAFGCALFTLLNPRIFLLTVRGHTEPMSGFLFVAFMFFLFRKSERETINIWICGALLGLLFLTRNYLLFALPAAGYYVYQKNRRLLPAFLLAFFLVCAPWLIRNYLLSGNPLFSLQNYGIMALRTLGMDDIFVNTVPMTAGYVFQNFPLPVIARGIAKSAYTMFKNFPLLINPLLFLFLFWPVSNQVPRTLQGFILLLVGIVAAPLILYFTASRLLFFLVPLLTMVGMAKFIAVVSQVEKRWVRVAGWLSLGIITLLYVGFYYQEYYDYNRAWNNYQNKRPAAYARISSMIQEETLVVADSVASFIWYADKPALYLPAYYEALKYCHEILDFNYLVLFKANRRSTGYRELFSYLAQKQGQDITVFSPAKDRFLVSWQTFPFPVAVPPDQK